MSNGYVMFLRLKYLLFQNRSAISGFAPPCKQLILCRSLGLLGIHYHQFRCRQKAKTDVDYQPQLFHWPCEKGDLYLSCQLGFFR